MASGTQLGSKYFLGEPIGRGAMGVVYDASTVDGESLAIKLLRPELASDDKTVARFVQERQIFRRIDHPNVVRVHDLVAEGDQLGIVMDKVSAGDLRNRVEARSLQPSVAMKIAADVAAGLQAIHAADVVHRDLKPANILISETPDGLQPRISDFGISRLVSEAMTRTSTTIGTPLYMAPEAADKRGAQAPADIYSLGAMMFELLIGSAPFHEGGTFAVLRAHAQDPPPFIDGVPLALAELIDQMLAKEPSARPSAALVRDRLLPIIPMIDDSQTPIAIERSDLGASGWAAPSSTTNVIETGEDHPTIAMATGAGLAGAAGVESAKSAGVELEGVEPHISHEPSDSAETIFDPGSAAQPIGLASSFPPAASSPASSFPPAPPPSASAAGLAGPAEAAAAAAVSGSPPVERAGSGSVILDERPRRLTEIVVAVASLAAVVGVIGYLVTRNGGDESAALGSDGGAVVVESGAESQEGDASSDTVLGSSDAEGNGESGPGLFNGGTDNSGNNDDGGSDDQSAATTTPAAPTTVKKSTTTASTATTTTSGPATTATTVASTTTESITTTTKPTTTTSSTSTTTTTTAPVATPIAIVTGVSVDSVGPSQFHFNYSTNDVCGTGSFSVVEASSGTTVGSYTGANICYGPRHGGFPGHSSFPGFNLKPSTTYSVYISVKGTASEGGKPAGSGTATKSFQVTTSG
ncbi:MAG: serine/threonine-protein kinase [Acidimicrobiales bacterium]